MSDGIEEGVIAEGFFSPRQPIRSKMVLVEFVAAAGEMDDDDSESRPRSRVLVVAGGKKEWPSNAYLLQHSLLLAQD